VHHGIGHRGSPGSSVATQTYPKITVTTRAAGRTIQRNMKSSRPASSATLETYTTSRDATGKNLEKSNADQQIKYQL
jgi:hypothetical protein